MITMLSDYFDDVFKGVGNHYEFSSLPTILRYEKNLLRKHLHKRRGLYLHLHQFKIMRCKEE